MRKIYNKARDVIIRQDIVNNTSAWTFHRIYVFLRSRRGQKIVYTFVWKSFRFIWLTLIGSKKLGEHIYARWMRKNFPTKRDLKRFAREIKSFHLQPKISVLIVRQDAELKHFINSISSVQNQIYNNWVVCAVASSGAEKQIKSMLNEVYAQDDKIKIEYVADGASLSVLTERARLQATGEFVCVLNEGDAFSLDAFYFLVKTMNEMPEIDLVYTDEDIISGQGEVNPFFKPGWSPDSLLTRNYLGNSVFIRKNLLDKLNGFQTAFDESFLYDLWLRASEMAVQIHRIPRILFHSDARRNELMGVKKIESDMHVIREAISRRKIEAQVERISNVHGYFRINYALKERPKVSIIVPTKDNADVLKTCLDSIFNLTDYPDFEVVLVENNSVTPELFDLLDHWLQKEPVRFKVLEQKYPFNYSKLMNGAARVADGEFLVLLNNDTEVIQRNWLSRMLEYAQLDSIGAVGVKLFYPNDLIQHAGVGLGIGGYAGHVFAKAKNDAQDYFGNLNAVTNYSAVTAACLMVSKKKYEAVNGFDEFLAVEYNDVDFCLKLIEQGLYNVFLPDVQLYHYESLTRGHPHRNRKTYKRHIREVKYFGVRWKKWIDDDPFYNPNLSRLHTNFEPNIFG